MTRTPKMVLFAMAVLLSLFFAGFLTGAGPAGSSSSISSPEYVPGELLVKYKPQASSSAISSIHEKLRAETIRKIQGVHRLKLAGDTTVAQALEIFRNNPNIVYAEPNYIRTVFRVPNDPLFSYLWSLNNTGNNPGTTGGTAGADIHAVDAWDMATGNSAVAVAVIDTGVDYRHPDLAGRISTIRSDVCGGDSDPMDPNGHGTHVAGTIAAAGDNGVGVCGVNWNTLIMPVRTGNMWGQFTAADISEAVYFAVQNGARIINVSFGGTGDSSAEREAFSAARNAGVLVVAAAGNASSTGLAGSSNDLTPVYPASYGLDNIIAVAATNQNDTKCSWSNYGASSVHVAAPGYNIYSTRPPDFTEIWRTEFENGIASWTKGSSTVNWGTTSSRSYSGSYSLAVSPSGNYPDNTDSWVILPVDAGSRPGLKLNFYVTGKSESNYDFLYIEGSEDEVNWQALPVLLVGSNNGVRKTFINGTGLSGNYADQWYAATVDLGGFDNRDTVFIRFHFTSDSGVNDIGWFVDSVALSSLSAYAGGEYRYMSGTSMASPHVAGLAALLWGYKSELTYTQVRAAILNSVDKKISLSGLISSGGRINALNALNSIGSDAPMQLTSSASASGIILTWADNSLVESGFIIERRTEAAGAYERIASVGANVTQYIDTGVAASTTYTYRVAASYSNGSCSPYSNEASQTASQIEVAGSSVNNSGGGGGGCFIATAAFGSVLHPQVRILRSFRDEYLLTCRPGRTFVSLYYRISPPVAAVIGKNTGLRAAVRICLLPLIAGVWLLYHCGAIAASVYLIAAVLFPIFSMRMVGRFRSGSTRKSCKLLD